MACKHLVDTLPVLPSSAFSFFIICFAFETVWLEIEHVTFETDF